MSIDIKIYLYTFETHLCELFLEKKVLKLDFILDYRNEKNKINVHRGKM